HFHDRRKILPRQVAIWPCSPHQRVKLVLAILTCCHLGDDLLRQHVEGLLRDRKAVELAAAHAVEQCCALDQLVARKGKKPAVWRVLTKMSVVRCSPIRSDRRLYTWSQTSADITDSSGESGTSNARSRARRWPESTITGAAPSPRPAPTRKRATSSIGFCVAERPMRSRRSPQSAARRSSDSARWLPRLFGANA